MARLSRLSSIDRFALAVVALFVVLVVAFTVMAFVTAADAGAVTCPNGYRERLAGTNRTLCRYTAQRFDPRELRAIARLVLGLVYR